MGIRGLPKALRESGAIAGQPLKGSTKPVHVDFLACFFRLVQTRGFGVLQSDTRKAWSSSAISALVPDLEFETNITTTGSRKRKNAAEHSPTSMHGPPPNDSIPIGPEQTFTELLENVLARCDHKNIFISPDGLSNFESKKDQQNFRAIGYILDDVFSNLFNKDLTVLHVDGEASEQKRQEHRRRNQYLRKSLDGLEAKVDNPGTKPSKQLFRACKNVYRLPRQTLHHDILPVLHELGWTIHYCTYQADTCLARVCQDSAPDSTVIVTSDSDLMVYEGIQSLMMPAGRSRELMMYDKKKLLDHLDLPSEQHLLLACVVTSNDYVRNIPYFGLMTNCDIIRKMDLSALEPLGTFISNADRTRAIMPFIQLYLDEVKDRLRERKAQSKRWSVTQETQQRENDVQVEHYIHSITAFVERTETPMVEPPQPNDESPCSHETIAKILQELYSRKNLQQQQRRQSRNHTNSLTSRPPSDQISTSGLSDMIADMNMESAPPSASTHHGLTRSQLRQQQRRDRFKTKRTEDKHKKWRQSQFKSRLDNQQRYVVRSVNILNAPNVEESELLKMTIPEPRVRTATTNSAKKADSDKEPGPKKKKKKCRKPTKPKSDVVSLKTGFAKSFATSTQTLGSIQGCLRRALLPASERGRTLQRLNDNDFKKIASRIAAAVSTIAEARMYVCRVLDIIVYDALLKQRTPADDAGEDGVDLILDKSAGTAIVKYLFSLILNGKIDNRGPKTVKEKTKAAKRIAEAAFERLKEILPGFRPVNKDQICLRRLIVDAAAEFSVQLRKHFRDIPFTVGARMLKCGWSEADIPPGGLKGSKASENGDDDDIDVDDEEEVEEDEENEDVDDEDEDPKFRFEKGHLRRWWAVASQLPPSMMPIFGLCHQFKDPFVTFEERALPGILWTTSKKRPNPAAEATSKIMSAKDATKLIETRYGELTRILFYGNPQEIKRSKSVWQTPYGRRTTTMAALAESHPEVFSSPILEAFVDQKFKHIAKVVDSRERNIPCASTPPTFPTARLPSDCNKHPPRYAINNLFSTNGTELNINCYDTTKPHRKQTKFVPIYRIEKRFPTTESILREFKVSSVDDIEVWGIDPGEVNTAAFCQIVRDPRTVSDATASSTTLRPGVKAKNLAINRKSLYQPVFSHREKMNEMTSRRIFVTEDQLVEGRLWAKEDDSLHNNGVSFPSIAGIQNTLPPRQHAKVEDIENSTKKFFQAQEILHEFHSSKRVKRMAWSLKKAKRAEVNQAVDAILKECHSKTLFCYGNGSFRTGINFSSPHETFKAIFAQKATAAGHIVVLVDEYLTSSICPSCLETGISSRLAKPTMRSCVCLACKRWLHRDVIGAQNIATAGEAWIQTLSRPLPLCRPAISTSANTNICAENA